MAGCSTGTTAPSSADGVLFLFAKFPAPGRVKTRLIPALGPEGAAQFARACIRDIVHQLAETPHLTRVILYSPQDARPQFEALLKEEGLEGAWQLEPQVGGLAVDLTDKMQAALSWAAAHHPGAARLFIGMDTPDLPLDAAHRALAVCGAGPRAYIKPATDGGYVLLGLPGTAGPDAFDGVRWSCEETCADQIRQLEACELPCEVDAVKCSDVDEPADLEALRERLAQGDPDSCVRVRAFLDSFSSQ